MSSIRCRFASGEGDEPHRRGERERRFSRNDDDVKNVLRCLEKIFQAEVS